MTATALLTPTGWVLLLAAIFGAIGWIARGFEEDAQTERGFADAWLDGYAFGQDEERAAVVAELRAWWAEDEAECIERGEHRG